MPKTVYPTEHQEQCALIKWAQLASRTLPQLELLFAVPNGGKRSKGVAGKLKAEGVKPGVPDLMLPVPQGDVRGLFIEMKRINARPSDVSPEQQEWHERLRAQGYRVEVCKGWAAAREVIESYLSQ